MSTTASLEEKRRSRWIPWTFVGGFAVIIIANSVLVIFSITSWTGLETEDAYNKGLSYNKVLEAAQAQNARGWSTDVDYAAGHLVIRVVDRDGQGIGGLAMQATLIRPTHEGFDQSILLQASEPGRYVAALALPLAGNWDVRVQATGVGDPWYQSQRIWVK